MSLDAIRQERYEAEGGHRWRLSGHGEAIDLPEAWVTSVASEGSLAWHGFSLKLRERGLSQDQIADFREALGFLAGSLQARGMPQERDDALTPDMVDARRLLGLSFPQAHARYGLTEQQYSAAQRSMEPFVAAAGALAIATVSVGGYTP